MAHTPLILAQLNGDLTYLNNSSGGTASGAGALRYRPGHSGGVQAALIEEGTVNLSSQGEFEADGVTGWNKVGNADSAHETSDVYAGTGALRLIKPAASTSVLLQYGAQNGAPFPSGGTYIVSAMSKSSTGQQRIRPYAWYTSESGGGSTVGSYSTLSATGAWQKHVTPTIATTAGKTLTFITLEPGQVGGSTDEFSLWDNIQIEEKDHPTTFAPERDGSGALLPGYTVTGTGKTQKCTRAAASVSIPTAAPDWVAFRYRETETGAMSFGYITNLTGTNVGAYGKISHDGTSLVIQSDRLLVIGPVYAGTGSLNTTEQATLDAASTWTFGMDVTPDAPVVDAGPNATATINQAWIRTATFIDTDSTSWTATADYGDGAGPVAATVDPVNKTVALSKAWASTGVKTVTVSVTDDGGLTGSDTVLVTVTEGPTLGQYIVAEIVGTDATAPVVVLS